LKENACRYCPEGTNECGTHHQSPIDLERNRAVAGDPMENTCIDRHWMKYEDSTCTWSMLDDKNAFIIERHGLKMIQPIDYGNGGDENMRLDCYDPDKGHLFGRIDFSKGFHEWWFLSHIDFKVPSEHTQEGKRYSGEVQMAHFYSVTGEEAGVDNEMATVSIFLEAFEDYPPYPHLDRIICEWRKAEDKTREECGLPAVGPYPGCFEITRGHTPFPSEAPVQPTEAPVIPTLEPTTGPPMEPSVPPVTIPGVPVIPPTESPVASPTNSPTTTPPEPTSSPSLKPPPTPFPTVPTTSDPAVSITFAPVISPALQPIDPTMAPVVRLLSQSSRNHTRSNRSLLRRSVRDIIVENAQKAGIPDSDKSRIQMDPRNFRPPDRSDDEWGEWIEAYSAHDRGVATEGQRKLLANDQLSFHNYQFLIDVKTEYYFRYQGTSTIPPCYGRYVPGSRGNTNHWRVVKDPIRVNPRQIEEMERLLRERIAPKDDSNGKACKNDTAGKVEKDGHISVARPLMQFNDVHYMTFCECQDWPSKWPEDREWCSLNQGDQHTRLYEHPYNFESSSF
jgi:carbonic anhydrase